MPDSRIVDTNVPLVAAGAHDTATDQCQLNCADFIDLLLEGAFCLVLDLGEEAFAEYASNIHLDPPDASLASQFLWYILNNLGYPERICRVQLHLQQDGEYTTWPRDVELADFDPADRKWVALALAFRQQTGRSAPITYAVERDWDNENHRVALTRHGVEFDPLCAPDRHAGRHPL